MIWGEWYTFGINGKFGARQKKFSINFSKANTKFCLILHYNADNSYLLVNRKEILNLKRTIKILTFQLGLVCIANGFSNTEHREVSLNENVYEF